MKLRPLFELHVDIGVPVSAGDGPFGRRVFYPIVSGTFQGSEPGGTFDGKPLRGSVLPGGGDWVLIGPDEVSRLDIRLLLRTDDGWPIYLQAFGIITVNDAVRARLQDPQRITDYGETYFMTQPRFETGADLDPARRTVPNPYTWLTTIVAVGQGRLGPATPGFMSATWIETRSFVLEN